MHFWRATYEIWCVLYTFSSFKFGVATFQVFNRHVNSTHVILSWMDPKGRSSHFVKVHSLFDEPQMMDPLVYLIFWLSHLSISFYTRKAVSQADILYEEAFGFSAHLFYTFDLFIPLVQKFVRNSIRIAIAMTDFGLWFSGGKLIMWRETNDGLNDRGSVFVPALLQALTQHEDQSQRKSCLDKPDHNFKQSPRAMCFSPCFL